MADRREAPDRDAQAIAELGAQPIDQFAEDQQAARVACLKYDDQVAVVRFAPVKLLLQQWLEQAEHLAVEVVDGGGKKQQRTDLPAVLMGHGSLALFIVLQDV
ncbi:hypothetical protein D3C87_1700100 [compost metagenome]